MKAVLVFCEGRHDIVFVMRSLGVGGCTWLNGRIGELPLPFGSRQNLMTGLIEQRYSRQPLDALRLRQVANPPLPAFEAFLRHDASDTLFVLLRVHGQDQVVETSALLTDLDAVIAGVPDLDVTAYAATFFYDADDAGILAKLNTFKQQFSSQLGNLDSLSNGNWVVPATVPIGCFVFHSPGQQTGTLEDELGPMVRQAWPVAAQAAETFIDTHSSQGDRVNLKASERWKAIITCAGQFNHPGDPLSIVIGRNGLPASAYAASHLSKTVHQFLMAVPWPILTP